MINELLLWVQESFKKLGYSEEGIKINFSNRTDCDFQCDNAFSIAKQFHVNPMEVATKVAEQLNLMPNFSEYLAKVEACNGFINISVSNKFIVESINKMCKAKNFGLNFAKPDEVYFLDYGGPNIAKPLHVGHLRSAIVGESIKRIIQFAGGKTVSDIHFGDYGLPIGEVIYGMKQRNIGIDEVTLNDLNTIYPQVSALCKENSEIYDICANITKELQDGNEEYHNYFLKILDLSGKDIISQFDYLDVKFDLLEGESNSYKILPALFEKFKNEQLIRQSEGAYVIDIAEPSDPKEYPPLLFRKSNGAYLYGSTDIATISDRMERFSPSNFIYVADLRQTLHFTQVFRASKITGIAKNASFNFCGIGTVNGLDGKPFKTRSGNTPKLSDLFVQIKELLIKTNSANENALPEDLDKIVNSVIKFADLQNNREKNYIFDIEKFSKVIGKTGPYVLYTFLRLNKVLQSENMPETDLMMDIYSTTDRNLRFYLLELNSTFKKAFEQKMPSYVCDYIYNLCLLANNFYETHRIKTETGINKKQNLINVIYKVTAILKSMLWVIGITPPSVM